MTKSIQRNCPSPEQLKAILAMPMAECGAGKQNHNPELAILTVHPKQGLRSWTSHWPRANMTSPRGVFRDALAVRRLLGHDPRSGFQPMSPDAGV